MKLIVGLGNPGRQYAGTRHNVGFAVAEVLAKRFGPVTPRARFRGETIELNMGGHRTLVLCPHTLMNRSGLSVLDARDFYKLEPADLLVVCDDLNLPLAKLRCRSRGTSGGQKGLQDIVNRLGTDEVPRLRIGIGQPPAGWDAAGFVLSKFQTDELDPIREAIERAANAAGDWVLDGIEVCMNRYNAEIA